MDPHRWQRIEQIYFAALPLAQPQRAAYVSSVCFEDPMLQREVETLLHADESSGQFLETAIFDVGLRILADDDSMNSETAVEMKVLTGKTLDGRYLIDRELGHGGVGLVYLAYDQKLHRKRVVVKVLLEKSLDSKWILQKFQQEKEALARVDHPGIVGILDAGELPQGQPYIVIQFVDGISLREAIRSEPEGLALHRVAAIIKQIGSALNSVHEQKIFHRDLKPENIMLQRLSANEEQVKILDFGIAKVKESLVAPSTATGVLSAGTILYMSPEQLRGDKVTAVSDIFSLGVTAYEMITGRRPFSPDTIAQLSDMQRAGVRVNPIDLRPRLPPAAQEIILRSLSFDPADRYQNAAKFGDDLAHAILADEDEISPWPRPDLAVTEQPTAVGGNVSPQSETIVTPFEPVPVPGTPQVIPPSATVYENRRRIWPVALAVFLAVAVIGGVLIFANRQSLFGAKTNAEAVQHSLVYSLTVQKMRNGQPYQEPFQSSGQEIFENGYQFRLNVTSPNSGYLYVFNEGADQNGALSFTIIYPTPATNSGSAKIDSDQKIQTNWNEFSGKAGTEQFWMVWAASSTSLLEAARDEAFKGNGRIADAAMIRSVKEFLSSHADPKLETTKDTARRETRVRGSDDVLVKLVELEHR